MIQRIDRAIRTAGVPRAGALEMPFGRIKRKEMLVNGIDKAAGKRSQVCARFLDCLPVFGPHADEVADIPDSIDGISLQSFFVNVTYSNRTALNAQRHQESPLVKDS